MGEPCEIVVCHDILQVPYEASYLLVWAATQTFTIRHLNDEGADTNCIRVPADLGDLTGSETCFSSSYPNENVETRESMQLSDSNLYCSPDTECINFEINILSDELSDSQDEGHVVLDESKTVELAEEQEQSFENPLAEPVATLPSFLPRYAGPWKNYADVEGEIVCGVCERKFDTDSAMHHHRVEHFGYFCGSDRTKKCVFCGDKFQSIVSLSLHLFEHYPKMIMMRKIKELNSERKRLRKESLIKSKSRKPARTKAQTKTKPKASTKMKRSPKSGEQNYPLTNNDRQKISEQTTFSTGELDSNGIRKEFAEFKCGVCEMRFHDSIIMHNHRISHFGYYRSLGMGRKCVFCSDRLTSVTELSEHLFLHYPTLKCPDTENISET